MKVIAHIHTDFPEKFGIPRQSGLVESLQGRIVFEPPYRNPEALRGLEAFSHIWLIWEFSQSVRQTWSPTVRPPRLGGQCPYGGICYPFPLSAQSHRPVLCTAGKNSIHFSFGARFACVGRRYGGWYAPL